MELSKDQISELQSSLIGKIILPENIQEYEEARKLHNTMHERKKPLFFVQPQNNSDIIHTIRFARDHNLPFSIKGGGHNSSGKSLIDHGITLDLSSMKNVLIDPKKKIAIVQGGARWRDLDREASPHHLATSGGIISSTGVCGLTLGGGWGWLTPQHGLACDNVIEVEMISYEGEVIIASEKSNPDLFWALRGGGGNFGVISSMTFQLHDIAPKVTGGLIIYEASRSKEIFQIYFEESKNYPTKMVAWPLFTLFQGNPVCGFLSFYEGPKTESDPYFKRYLDAQPLMVTLDEKTFDEHQKAIDFLHLPSRHHWKSGFLQDLTIEIVQQIWDKIQQIPQVEGLKWEVMFENYFYGSFSRVKTRETAFPHRNGKISLLLTIHWKNSEDDDRCLEWNRSFHHSFSKHFIGAAHNFENEMESEEIWANNTDRLVEVKKKYDPQGFFSGVNALSSGL